MSDGFSWTNTPWSLSCSKYTPTNLLESSVQSLRKPPINSWRSCMLNQFPLQPDSEKSSNVKKLSKQITAEQAKTKHSFVGAATCSESIILQRLSIAAKCSQGRSSQPGKALQMGRKMLCSRNFFLTLFFRQTEWRSQLEDSASNGFQNTRRWFDAYNFLQSW